MIDFMKDYMMPEQNTNNRKIGIVKELQSTFGFIADGEEDRFFHWSYMHPDSKKPFHHLVIGDRVYFVPTVKDNKPQASEVSVVPYTKKKPS